MYKSSIDGVTNQILNHLTQSRSSAPCVLCQIDSTGYIRMKLRVTNQF